MVFQGFESPDNAKSCLRFTTAEVYDMQRVEGLVFLSFFFFSFFFFLLGTWLNL